ncbi:hypothetical protein PRUPE_2G219000 [Prunus persica]|uniref:Uncharacterized protein n=1 Tax=Prunus persica TaxID=3760 RepID=A0A251QJW6_PRUPE|nr:hypothetical protein PRUPE_2G219000 [Prunus persica]
MVNLDQSMNRLSLMHGGGLLPRIHALQISFVGSHGPSSTGGDDKLGSSSECLVLRYDFRIFCCFGPNLCVL